MPRLIRRQSVRDRILSILNPLDMALDLYTYIESYDWDGVQSTTSTPIGLALNILLFVARLNCSPGVSSGYEDVLRTSSSGKYYGKGWGSGSKVGHLVCTANLPTSSPFAPILPSHYLLRLMG